MKKDGYSENTVGPIGRRLRNLAKHADLDTPEEAKSFIARAEWSNGYKGNVVNAYSHYAAVHRLSWKKPRYQRAFSIKKLPLESDIDLIISHTRTKNRAAFKLVKECGLRPIEISRLTLKQIGFHNGLVYPETAKGGEARVIVPYNTVNRKVRTLEEHGYIEKSGKRKAKTGFAAKLYQLTARTHLAMLLNRIDLNDFTEKVPEAMIFNALAAFIYPEF